MITGNEPAMPSEVKTEWTEQKWFEGKDCADGVGKNINVDKFCINSYSGLTIRQHFAAMAMQGLCAGRSISGHHIERITADSVLFADALIAELNKYPHSNNS